MVGLKIIKYKIHLYTLYNYVQHILYIYPWIHFFSTSSYIIVKYTFDIYLLLQDVNGGFLQKLWWAGYLHYWCWLSHLTHSDFSKLQRLLCYILLLYSISVHLHLIILPFIYYIYKKLNLFYKQSSYSMICINMRSHAVKQDVDYTRCDFLPLLQSPVSCCDLGACLFTM